MEPAVDGTLLKGRPGGCTHRIPEDFLSQRTDEQWIWDACFHLCICLLKQQLRMHDAVFLQPPLPEP